MIGQLFALAIFIFMFIHILWGKYARHTIALLTGGGMLLLLLFTGQIQAFFEALSLDSFFNTEFWFAYGGVTELNTGINWSTIFFLSGMMILAEEMSLVGFFDWISLRLAKSFHYKPMLLMMSFMLLSAVLSMFVDSITVILFLVAVTVHIAQLLKFDPVPLIIGEIFTANLGGAATMSGDPPNIILGTSLGLSFWDFIVNNGTICLLGLLFILPYFYICFRRKLGDGITEKAPELIDLNPEDAITDRKRFGAIVTLFGIVLILLMTHTITGFTMPTIGLLVAAGSLLIAKQRKLLLRSVDWGSIGFILGLFLTVSGLGHFGFLQNLAQILVTLSGENPTMMVVLLIWFTAMASAFVDNIPIATIMVPVITAIAEVPGMDLHTLTWTLSKGTDIGGIATPIGASANVTGLAIAAREGQRISWKRYCKYTIPACLILLLMSMILILVRH